VPKVGWMRTLFQGCIRATRKKIQEIRPDIVHGQGTEADCSLGAVFSGFPNVLTLHGNMRAVAHINGDGPFSYNWMAARLERFVLPRTNGVVCITNYTRRAVVRVTPQTWVIPNAVDITFFDLQAKPDLSVPPIGLCVGTICGYKNQNMLVRALDPLVSGTKFKIVFAGGITRGIYGEEFHRLIRERPWCEHVGFLNREQLKTSFRSAAFLVLPTLEDNCPMVVLEAMAAGVPVVASNVGGVPDLIEHEVSGLLCNPERPETFRTTIARFLDDRELALRIAIKAKARAQRRFHPQIIAQQHLGIYQDILSEN
jgi:glycosyltransferase involved in cell wall biosynthesis